MNLPLPWDLPGPWLYYGALIFFIGICCILLGRCGEEKKWLRSARVFLLAAGTGLLTPVMTYCAFHFFVDPNYILLHDRNFGERFGDAIFLPAAPMASGLLSISVVFVGAFIISCFGKTRRSTIWDAS